MVGGWAFLLVPVHPGSPGQRAVKQLLFLLCLIQLSAWVAPQEWPLWPWPHHWWKTLSRQSQDKTCGSGLHHWSHNNNFRDGSSRDKRQGKERHWAQTITKITLQSYPSTGTLPRTGTKFGEHGFWFLLFQSSHLLSDLQDVVDSNTFKEWLKIILLHRAYRHLWYAA